MEQAAGDVTPFLCADLLATLGAGVHVVALQSVLDGHLVQRLLNQQQQDSMKSDGRTLAEKAALMCFCTHVDVLHVGHLTPDGVKLLGGLTDVVAVLQEGSG